MLIWLHSNAHQEQYESVFDLSLQYQYLGQFVMPEICEHCLGLVNSCIYYAHHTYKIYQVLPHSVDFKAPIHWVRQYLVNVLFWKKFTPETSEMTVKLKINL